MLRNMVGGLSMKRFTSTRGFSTKTALSLLPLPSSSARESPTNVILVNGPFHASSSYLNTGFVQQFHQLGHSVGLLDLPGYGKAQGLPADWTLEDLVSDVRNCIAEGNPFPPVVIAPSSSALFFQTYLESHALGALILLSPLPPNPMPYLQRRCGSSDPSHPPTRQAITAWLSGLASFEEDVAANLCREEGPSFSDCLRQAEAACAVDVSQEQGSAGKTLCGVEAVAQLLHLTCREPVNLEPSPVPMLLAAGAEDPLLSKEEVQETVDLHNLPPADIILVPGARHSLLHDGAESQEWQERIRAFIASRF